MWCTVLSGLPQVVVQDDFYLLMPFAPPTFPPFFNILTSNPINKDGSWNSMISAHIVQVPDTGMLEVEYVRWTYSSSTLGVLLGIILQTNINRQILANIGMCPYCSMCEEGTHVNPFQLKSCTQKWANNPRYRDPSLVDFPTYYTLANAPPTLKVADNSVTVWYTDKSTSVILAVNLY